MADTNTYDLFQKVEKWTTKEKFNALDPRTIETGTEYNLAGQIDESDLGSDLLAKINGKLTAPANPSAESAVTMLADGTVGTKLLSEIGGSGGGKLYLHRIDASHFQDGFTISIAIINTSSEPITDVEYIKSHLVKGTFGDYDGTIGKGAVNFYYYLPPDTYRIEGVIVDANGEPSCLDYSTTIDAFEDISRTEL